MRRTRHAGLMMLAVAFVLVAALAAQAQTTTKVITGEVVQVEGRSLVVKLADGTIKTFKPPSDRKFEIDGVEVGLADLKPGTSLTATIKTTSKPVTVRTRASVSGTVWYVAPPTIILTDDKGENKQYTVKADDNVAFTVEGRPGTLFDLKKGMKVTASKIVEEEDVEITTDTKITGTAPKPVEPPPAPAAQPPAAESTPPAAPAETPAEESSNTTMWVVIVAVLALIGLLMFWKSKKS